MRGLTTAVLVVELHELKINKKVGTNEEYNAMGFTSYDVADACRVKHVSTSFTLKLSILCGFWPLVSARRPTKYEAQLFQTTLILR
jgi:hypothetical protein